MIKKLIHTADWHLQPDVYHNQFKSVIDNFLSSIAEEIKKEGVKPEEVLVCIVGDLFDNKSK